MLAKARVFRAAFLFTAAVFGLSAETARAQTALTQIDCGGGAVSPFGADTGFNTGNEFSSTATISTSGVTNPAPAAVYQSVRWASAFNYTLGGYTAGTSYTVRLHFVELSFTASGSRVFNVALNGTSVLSSFDIYSQVGQNHALVEQFNTTANSSGQIVVAFTQGSADNPSVAGIEVTTLGAPATPTGVSATAGNATGTVSWGAVNYATSYNLYRSTTAGGEGTTAYKTGITTTSSTDTGLTNGTKYYYKVAAVSSGGTSAQSSEVNLTPSSSGPPANTAVLQIDAGGGAVAPFVADTDFSSSNAFTSTATINTSGVANAAPAAVYQSVRWNSSFNYTLPGLTPGSSYVVRLHFVELSFTASGSRIFNVGINGTNVLSNFDIFAQAGANKALVEQFNATANSSGQIVVAFTQGSADNPSVAGLEVWTPTAGTAPTTPAGLTATAGSGSVALSWNASSGAATYNVYRSTTSGGEGATAYALGLTNTSYSDTSVTNGTRYYYTVAAVNSYGTSAQSSEASATPTSGVTIPPVPTGVGAASGTTQVTVSWSSSSGATSYNLYRSTTAGGEGSTAYKTGLTGTSYTDTGLTAGTPYYYKVAAVNSAGASAQSSEVSATPSSGTGGGTPNTALIQIDCGSPAAVAPFVADTDYNVGTEFSSTAAIVTSGTNHAAPAAVYQTVRWNSAFNYTIGGLTSGTSYVVRLHFVELSFTAAGQRKFNVAINGNSVLAALDVFSLVGQNHALEEEFNATANSSGQIVVAFTTGGADNPDIAGIEIWTQPPLPSAPTALSATGTTSQVALSWTAGANATSYNVYRGTSAGGESATPIATGLLTTSFTDTTVTNGTTYYYTVASVDSAGASAKSNEASALPHVVAPSAPSSPTASANFGSNSLSWSARSGAATYTIYRGTTAGGEGATAYATGVTGTSYTDSNVTAGTTYYYTIVAVNSAGSSVASSEVSATPLSATGQGASFPYTRYRAADSTASTYGGGATLKSAPTFAKMNLAAQASGQAYVELSSSGAYVQWKVAQSNLGGVTMRFTLPDSASGYGQNGTVDVYVNGTKVKTVNLTSYYAWQYFGGGGDPSDTPTTGVPAFAFDEVHWTLPTALNSGDTIKIQSSGGPVVGVDFIETESIPGQVAQPAGSVSVASYGAVAYSDNSAAYAEIAELEAGQTVTLAPGVTDSLPAFQAAVTAALASSSKTLYIPAGTYYLSSMWVIGSTTSPISQLNIVGAGIWYTNIQFTNPNVAGGGCSIRLGGSGTMNYSNVYLNSMLRSRYNENAIYKAFMDNFGVNSNFHDLWEEHFECGYWVADYAYTPCQVASNLTIQNNRIRNNLADGVNFCNGTFNSTVTNCSIRNGGDDGLAIWSNNFNGAPMETNNTFTHNTIEFEWRSAGIAIYGGSGHQVTYNLVEDTFMSAGFRANTTFSGYQFQNNTGITVANDTFICCGTSYDAWAGELGAVDLEASNTSIQNFTFTNIQVIDAQRDGYSMGFAGGFSGINYNSCTANGTGLDGISTSKYTQAHLGAGIATYSSGAATFTGFTYASCAGGEIFNQGGFVLTFK